ncbi:hypothetical protein BLNAU_13781 [Blattamonas nauphoetae]|uniref:Uncharacterized protein n=1 Tax=Blattamonas nauphoetae TaxID=2049346 RepID=A0ABQ9XKE1_9EUKA|nr:hypothetical protein BLNAU_13781 [Blattamonas nauphoetae]
MHRQMNSSDPFDQSPPHQSMPSHYHTPNSLLSSFLTTSSDDIDPELSAWINQDTVIVSEKDLARSKKKREKVESPGIQHRPFPTSSNTSQKPQPTTKYYSHPVKPLSPIKGGYKINPNNPEYQQAQRLKERMAAYDERRKTIEASEQQTNPYTQVRSATSLEDRPAFNSHRPTQSEKKKARLQEKAAVFAEQVRQDQLADIAQKPVKKLTHSEMNDLLDFYQQRAGLGGLPQRSQSMAETEKERQRREQQQARIAQIGRYNEPTLAKREGIIFGQGMGGHARFSTARGSSPGDQFSQSPRKLNQTKQRLAPLSRDGGTYSGGGSPDGNVRTEIELGRGEQKIVAQDLSEQRLAEMEIRHAQDAVSVAKMLSGLDGKNDQQKGVSEQGQLERGVERDLRNAKENRALTHRSTTQTPSSTHIPLHMQTSFRSSPFFSAVPVMARKD